MESAIQTNKIYYTYDQIHNIVAKMIPAIRDFEPDVILAIGGGGFIPARMIRSYFSNLPILAISMEAYNNNNNKVNKEAIIHQWFDEKTTYGALVRNGRILIVDEIDDTRLTLSKCIAELNKHQPSTIGVAVIHNKNKKKCYTIPNNITYIAGEIVNDNWIHYPWETTCEVNEI